jgi:hypothetical protein
MDLLIIYLDGVIFAKHHVLVAVGVDTEGRDARTHRLWLVTAWKRVSRISPSRDVRP